MEQKRPQLNLDELHQLKWLLGGTLALVAAWSALYFDINSWALTAALTIAIPIMLARPDWAARWPAWMHRLAFPVVVLVFAADLYVTKEVLPPMIRLDMLLLLYRATTLRRRREDLQLIVLGLFLIVVAGVLTVSLAFAAQILAFTACALVFMLTITLVEAQEARSASSGQAGAAGVGRPSTSPPSWTRVRWRRLATRLRAAADWRMLALGGALFVGVVSLSALLFLTIPRFELANSLFLDRLIARHTRTGFSEVVHFGDVTDIKQDDSVALRVEPPGRQPPPADLYWRMLVLDEYRHGEFRASARLSLQAENLLNENVVRGRERATGAGAWTFYLEPSVSRYLPLAGGFSELRLGETTDLKVNRQTRIIALRSEPATMMAYRVTGMRLEQNLPDPAFARRLGGVTVGGRTGTASPYLEANVPESDRTVLKKFADEIAAAGPGSAAEFSRRAMTWLDQRHSYSLQMSLPPGEGDPLVRWLGSREPGHCELFAGSLVLLARAAGYPARMVTGFRGGDWNAFENYLMVRDSDAHAWCEIFDSASSSWLRVDPTPGVTAATATASLQETTKGVIAANRSWSARIDSLRLLWYRHIVNFDQARQRSTLQSLKLTTEEMGRRFNVELGRWAAKLRAWLSAPWSLWRAAKIAAAVAALVVLVLLLRRVRWSWRWRFGAKRGSDPIRREAGRWLARLRTQAKAGGDEVRAELERLRFGSRATWPAPAAVFRRARHLARR